MFSHPGSTCCDHWPVSHVPVTTHLDSQPPGHQTHSSALHSRDSGDSGHRRHLRLSLRSGQYLVTNPHRSHHSHGSVSVSSYHQTENMDFLETLLLKTVILYIRRVDRIDNICGTCKLWARPGHWPCLHVTGEKLGSERELSRSGVRRVETKKCRERASVPHPDTARWPLTIGGAPVSHSRPLLMWHPSYASDSVILQMSGTIFVFISLTKTSSEKFSYTNMQTYIFNKIWRLRDFYWIMILESRKNLIELKSIGTLMKSNSNQY